LSALAEHGRTHRRWRRILLPGYFCPEVVRSVLRVGIPVVLYPAGPLEYGLPREEVPLYPGDAVLAVNYFGLRSAAPPKHPWRADGVELVEDHTHDPWSPWAHHSSADWCLASLRKTVPVPDGAVVWSPAGHTPPLPPQDNSERYVGSLEKTVFMALKAEYLTGGGVDKRVFLDLLARSEQRLSAGAPGSITPWSRMLLRSVPVARWRRCRSTNFAAFRDALAGVGAATVLAPADGLTASPLAAVVVFDTKRDRDRVRAELIERAVYPAIHWCLESLLPLGCSGADADLSGRVLSITCDMRYGVDDMLRVAELLRRAVERA